MKRYAINWGTSNIYETPHGSLVQFCDAQARIAELEAALRGALHELRDGFAGQALQGLIAYPGGLRGAEGAEGYAARAYEYADAMLAERSKTK